MVRDRETVGSRTVKASEFKVRCLRLMEEVAESREEIVITKRGRPVSPLVPCRHQPKEIFGADRDTIRIHGEIVADRGSANPRLPRPFVRLRASDR